MNNKFKIFFFSFLTIFLLAAPQAFSGGSGGLEFPETDSSEDGLAAFFDLRDRETYIQVTNTGNDLNPDDDGDNSGPLTVHVQIFNVAENCNDPATNPDGKRCVANMSLGGGFSQAENDIVNAAVAAGIVFVVAAGNDAGDACGYSPASAANATTVGSTTITDSMSGFSNYGSCMDIWAPGSNIKAAWIGSNTATRTISGTSMASPRKFFFLVFIIFVIFPISNLATNQRVYCSLSLLLFLSISQMLPELLPEFLEAIPALPPLKSFRRSKLMLMI